MYLIFYFSMFNFSFITVLEGLQQLSTANILSFSLPFKYSTILFIWRIGVYIVMNK